MDSIPFLSRKRNSFRGGIWCGLVSKFADHLSLSFRELLRHRPTSRILYEINMSMIIVSRRKVKCSVTAPLSRPNRLSCLIPVCVYTTRPDATKLSSFIASCLAVYNQSGVLSSQNKISTCWLYIGWQWRNFNASWLSRHLVGKTLINVFTMISLTLCWQASDHTDIFVNQRIECYIN